MLARLSRDVESHLAGAAGALGDLAQAMTSEYVWNVDGYDNAMARAEQLINGARERILIGIWSKESARLAGAVAGAQARGVGIVTLCIEGCPHECGGCQGDVYRYAVAQEASSRWLMLVVDDKELVVAQISNNGEAQAAQTSLEVFVQMTSQYLRDAIATAEIGRSLGSRLPKLLDRDAAGALQGAGLATRGESWLKRLSAIARRSPR